jgi:hypothetical protein
MESKEKRLSTEDIASGSDRQSMNRDTEIDSRNDKESNVVSPEAGADRAGAKDRGDLVPLFSNDAVQDYRSRWNALQTGFVDEPRRAVEEADELVAQVIKDLAETFSNERTKLERQWDQGDKVSTEDLRLVLQRYRSFFDRFLSV